MKNSLVVLLSLIIMMAPMSGWAATPQKATSPVNPKVSTPTSGAAAYQNAIDAAKKSNNTVGAVKGYFSLGTYYSQQNNLAATRATYNQGLAYASQHLPPNHPLIGLLLCQLSTTYMVEQNFEKSLSLMSSGISILDQSPQMTEVAFKLRGIKSMLTSFNSGLQSLKLYDYSQAEMDFKAAVEVGQQIQEPGIISVSLSSLGLAQMMLDKNEEAEACLKQAMQYAKTTGKQDAWLMAVMAYGSLKSKQGKLDEAKGYFQQALAQDDATFQRIKVSKQLFENEMARLNMVQTELDRVSTSPNEPDYLKDVRLTKKIFHWNEQNGVIKVYIAPGDHLPGWKPEYAERFKKACLQWQGVLGDRIRFEFTNDPNEKVDTRVTWNGGYQKLAGLTRYLHASGKLVVADIDVNLQNYDGQLYDPQTVYKLSLHEVGHLLGIAGHSKNPNDIMFPALSMASTLSSRDIATMRKLYLEAPEITNPSGMTLSEYRNSAEYQAAKAAAESMQHF